MPQVRCPNCGVSINLESRKRMDFSMIVGALRNRPQTFTNLLQVTGLPRKTLSLRLKDLLSAGIIIKNGGYLLNGSSSFDVNDRTLLQHDRKRDLPNLKRNLILMFLVLCIVVPLAAQAYALYFAPQPVIEPPPPMPPTAAFTISPSHTCQIDWIEQWNGESMERIYQYPTLTFYGTHSRDPEGQMVSYTWNFGDGAFGSEPILTHTYAAAGTYTVSLTVVDSQGLTSSTTKTVTVLPAPKTTVYIAPSTLTGLAIGDSFTVTVMVSDVSDLYLWNIGVVFNPEVIECLSVEKAGNFASKRSVLDGADVGYIVEENLFPGTAGETVWVTPKINNAAGVIGPGPACGLIGDVPGVSGSGAVATITFRVLSSGSSFIQLTDVHLANSIMQEIAVNVGNGYFVLP